MKQSPLHVDEHEFSHEFLQADEQLIKQSDLHVALQEPWHPCPQRLPHVVVQPFSQLSLQPLQAFLHPL